MATFGVQKLQKDLCTERGIEMRLIKPCQIIFADEKVEKEFNDLDSNNDIEKWINRAREDIKKNAFCGIQLPKRLIPKEYIQKYGIINLWKYDLPDG